MEAFFWEFVRIAEVKKNSKWPLYNDLTQPGATRPSGTDLETFIRNKLKAGLFGRGEDGSFCVKAADGRWWLLMSAYRLAKVAKGSGVRDDNGFRLWALETAEVHMLSLPFEQRVLDKCKLKIILVHANTECG